MSTAQAACTSVFSEVMQSVAIVIVTVFLATNFFGASLGKQTGPCKSPEILKRKGGDVTLTQRVTHEKRQSGSQGALGQWPAQKSQQMSPATSVGSGEELAEKAHRPSSRGRFLWKKDQAARRRRLARLIALLKKMFCITSGDSIKHGLVNKIQRFQSSGTEECRAWAAFCQGQEVKNRDPSRYPVDVLQQFVQDHCSSEDCSWHPLNAIKQLHCPTRAQALAPWYALSQKAWM